jgi:uncharacterized protein YndB with AHSA1/START domain
MQQLNFSIDIHASRDAVWCVLWAEESFRDWASTFVPGSRIRADWREGGRFEFTDSSGGVSYGVIERLVPGEVMHFNHAGEIRDGLESPFSDGSRREVYSLSERGGVTRLTLEQDVPDDFVEMFAEATPRAFSRIKELCESR